jgi:GTPase involved in cell partitioning and DNA repair
MKNYLFIALGLGFLFLGFNAYQKSVPIEKNAAIYDEIKKYSPYYLDKRFGGLMILNKKDKEFKEKPTNMMVFKRLDELEQKWGQRYLKVSDSQVIVLDDENKTIVKLPIVSKEDRAFLQTFYGL